MAKKYMATGMRKRRTRALRKRDGDLCYICGIAMDFVDRKGQLAATIDHVNPMGIIYLTTVTV